MITILNQFEGKDTYIVGILIKNGCQIFKIEDLDEVCQKWSVSDSVKETVRAAYEENLQTEEDWEYLSRNNNPDIRKLVALQGKCLDTLIGDIDINVRAAMASYGYGLDTLINDPCYFVRMAVAYQGYGLDILINDPSSAVRCVARSIAAVLKT